MLSRTAFRAARPLLRPSIPTTTSLLSRQPFSTTRLHRAPAEQDLNISDPGMNGGYPVLDRRLYKRQYRDPYGDWWDKQDRRNFGEPVHEDNDILGIFSPHDYDEIPPGRAARWFISFWIVFAMGLYVVYLTYPDVPAVPRTFPGGLDRELGGRNAVIALADEDEEEDS